MMRRSVSVEIGELVLDGCCAPRHADRVAAALTGELERLLRLQPLDRFDRKVDLADGEFAVQPNASPEAIGREAAHAVHRRLVS